MKRWPDRAALVVPLVAAVTLLVAVALALSGPGPTVAAAQPTPVDSCTTIYESGEYELVTDIVDDRTTRLSQACIKITADDVVFDGGGHLVDGKGISDTTGVRVRGASDVVVRDVRVTNWNRGVHYDGVTGGAVVGVNATSNARGLDFDRSQDVTVEGGTYTANLIGVDLARENRDVAVPDAVATGNHVVDVYRPTGNETSGGPGTPTPRTPGNETEP